MESRLNRETCDEETRDEANCIGQPFDGILVPSGESYRSGMAGLFLGVDRELQCRRHRELIGRRAGGDRDTRGRPCARFRRWWPNPGTTRTANF